jgi:SNF2 family DNA or RNA helicase
MTAYRLTGLAKIRGVCDFIETLVENGAKFLVFAHHKCMIEGIEDYLRSKQFGYVRIDGRTPPDTRYAHVKQFQTDSKVRIALLSIMAASQGLTLTAASCVVFAELTWTPSIMNQAEDRAHRIGQKNSVNIYYLHGKETVDDMIFKILHQKSLVTTGVTDGRMVTMNLKEQELKQIDYDALRVEENLSTSHQQSPKPEHRKPLFPHLHKVAQKSAISEFFEGRRNRGNDETRATEVIEEISDEEDRII